MKNRKDFELLAPVGSYESLHAAIKAGADAVYFGAENLNMRASSSINFTLSDLKNIADICSQNSVKTYLTLNTVIFDHEMEQMKNIVDSVKNSNIHGIIASDMAVIQYARSIGVEVHASTQLNISNVDAVRFFAQFCDVMVTARELSLEQVKHITQQIKQENICGPSGNRVRIETFVHGALCMAISGKCYLSLHETGKSANRGTCRQTCRKSYVVTEKETAYQLEIDNQYIMSPKDLCTIPFFDKIIEAGIQVLKIEGRARGPEYVYRTVDCYNQALEAVLENCYNPDKISQWEERLSTVFNRGFWDGYYLGKPLGEWSKRYGSQATKRKMYIAKAINYFSNLEVAEFKMESGELKTGDEIIITGPTTGIIEMHIPEIRVNEKNVEKTVKGEHFSIPVPEIVRRSDKMYCMLNEDEIKNIQ